MANKVQKIGNMFYMEFRCAVIEDGVQCNNRHLEPVRNKEEIESLDGAGFLCETCQEKGYSWYSRLLGTTDEDGSLITELATDSKGAKNTEFRQGDSLTLVDNWERKGVEAEIASGFKVGNSQKKKGDKGYEALRGWSMVRYCPELGDILMLRNDEANDPKAPTVTRKDKKVFGIATKPKDIDPFADLD